MSIDISLIISLASFINSIYTLWVTRLAGFKLDVTSTARIEITTNPQSLGAKQSAIIIRLLFTNKGAQLGLVHDVAVTMQKVDSQSKPLVFRSLFENVEETLNLSDQLPPTKLLAFSSFPILTTETIAKKIVFVPVIPQLNIKFEQGRYQITPYTRDPNSGSKWVKWKSIEIDVTDEDLQVLGQTMVIPTGNGGQFVKWLIHSKPTKHAEDALQNLQIQIGK